MPLVRNFIMFSRNCFKSKLQIRHFSPLRITWLCWQPAGIHLSNRITTSWRWKMGQKQEECLFLKVKGKRANQEGMEALGMGKTKQSAVDLREVTLTQHSCTEILQQSCRNQRQKKQLPPFPFQSQSKFSITVRFWGLSEFSRAGPFDTNKSTPCFKGKEAAAAFMAMKAHLASKFPLNELHLFKVKIWKFKRAIPLWN